MLEHALIPLAATIAYVPLLLVSLLHKPWQREQGYFVLYLIPAMLWGLFDFFLRSDVLHINETVLVKVGLCLTFWMVVQLHYLLRSVDGEPVGIPVAFLPLVAIIALAASNVIPRSVEITEQKTFVDYGFQTFLVAIPLLIVIWWDVFRLIRIRKTAAQLSERNKLTYLIVVTMISMVKSTCGCWHRQNEPKRLM